METRGRRTMDTRVCLHDNGVALRSSRARPECEQDRRRDVTDVHEVSFRTTNILSDRYVWDPQAHHEYREHCRYLLLRFDGPDPADVPRIAKACDRALISSYCVYLIYGYYDVLVRVWCTAQKYERLMRLDRKSTRLNSSHANISYAVF